MKSKNIEIIAKAIESVDDVQFNNLLIACETVLKSGHKIIVSGLGKNVPICDKFVGTMLSLGMNAGFLHTNSAVHGDLGMVRPGDIVIILTKSGSTIESVYLTELIQKRPEVEIWLLSFKSNSILTEKIGHDKSLIVAMEHEGDLWNIVPNNSTTLNLIILQTLAIELSKKMGITLADFKENHPGGAIGDQLRNE